jgi:hypothetical protein
MRLVKTITRKDVCNVWYGHQRSLWLPRSRKDDTEMYLWETGCVLEMCGNSSEGRFNELIHVLDWMGWDG